VYTGEPGGTQYSLCVGLGIEARDITGDRAWKQCRVLRQVTELSSKYIAAPLAWVDPLNRISPRTRGVIPRIACTSVVLPAPEGPMIPKPSPWSSPKLIPASNGSLREGTTQIMSDT